MATGDISEGCRLVDFRKRLYKSAVFCDLSVFLDCILAIEEKPNDSFCLIYLSTSSDAD
jgi:hypothetical protein